ncbi:MAG: PAS domain S-box protein [Myxococcota bacterium]
MRPAAFRLALRTSLIYAGAAALWILFSDQLLRGLDLDADLTSHIALYKGWAFVAVTALLLFVALRRQLARWSDEVMKREQAEAARHSTEHRLAQYVGHAPMAVLVCDRQGRVLDANPAARELFRANGGGGDRPLDLRDLVASDDRALLTAMTEGSPDDGASDRELRLRRPGGGSAWLRVRGVHLDGERFLAFVDDITDRRQAERELARVARVEATLGRIHGRVARAASRAELLADLCAAATELGAYASAEVSERTPESSVDGSGAERRARVSDDGAVASVPIAEGGVTRLVLTLRTADDEPDAIHAPELALLEQAAINLAFALDTLALEAQRREAEAQLRASEERFRHVASIVGEVIWFRSYVPGENSYASPAFERIWGRPAADVMREPSLWLNPVVPEDRARVEAALARLYRGELFDMEYRIVRPDGGMRWVHSRGYPSFDATGKVVRASGVASDITARKQADLLLHEGEDRMRTLTENLPAGLFVMVDGAFAYLNAHAAHLFGATEPAPLLGTPVLERFDPDDQRAVAAWLAAARERGADPADDGSAPLSERLCLRLDGTPFAAELSAVPFAFSGRPGTLVFFRDIGDRRRLEAQLRQSQKMEAIGTLAGGVAHDFNNLLMVIQTATTIVRDGDAAPGEEKGLLSDVVEAAERAAGLTRQLLLFSRRQQMQLRDVALDDIVANVSKLLRRVLGEDVVLATTHPAQLPLVHGDVGMLEQVLVNLAVNARDAMPNGGQLSISTEHGVLEPDGDGRLPHPEASAGRYARLVVKDTGTGIAPDVLPHIFEPFFTTKEVGRGTGLGLATVYGIVRQHQGWIDVDSTVGVGTTFRISFPAREATRVQASQVATPPTLAHGRETLLLVEDEDAVRRSASAILARAGYNVLQASSAAQALELWAQHKQHIQLVVTDVVMPDRSGFDLVRALRAEVPRLTVVYSSGYNAHAGGEPEELVEGANYLRKPYGVTALTAIVRAQLDRAARDAASG